MNHTMKAKKTYASPEAIVVVLAMESFTMTSTQLEDYGDNPIFGMPLNPNI